MKPWARSRIFRYGTAYAGLFFISTLLVLTFLYSVTFRSSNNKVEERVTLEALWLGDLLSDCGEFEMVRRLNYHIADHPGNLGIYLLRDCDGKRLAGNIDLSPKVVLEKGQFVTFFHQDKPDSSEVPLHIGATVIDLDRGCTLLVGHDYRVIDQIKLELRPAAAWALGISFALGVLVAVFLSRRLTRRLEIINRTSREIFEGNLDTRMKRTGSGDEFDSLSTNLNRMLDRIFNLMASVRGVTDNIAHDLRSPLSRMRSRMEVALLTERPCSEYREVLAETIEDTDRLLATFNSLLTIARVESGAAHGEFKTIDLKQLVIDTVELYEPVAEENGQKIKMSCSGDLKIHCNPDLLVQALANLLDNAIKYAPQAANIEVTARGDGKKITLNVADGGPGIPEHFRAKALERFSRLEASRTLPGQGLGLSLVQVVARMHGGRVRLEDAEPGLRVVVELATGI